MLSLTGHILSARWPHMAIGYCITRYRQHMSIFAEYQNIPLGNSSQDLLSPLNLCYSLSLCPFPLKNLTNYLYTYLFNGGPPQIDW